MMIKTLVLAMGVLALGGAASAQQAPNPNPSPTPQPEKKVCRTDTATGSMLPKRTCRTAGEWAQIDGANAVAAENFGNMRRSSGGGIGTN